MKDPNVEGKLQGGVSMCGDYILFSYPIHRCFSYSAEMSVGASRGHWWHYKIPIWRSGLKGGAARNV